MDIFTCKNDKDDKDILDVQKNSTAEPKQNLSCNIVLRVIVKPFKMDL